MERPILIDKIWGFLCDKEIMEEIKSDYYNCPVPISLVRASCNAIRTALTHL